MPADFRLEKPGRVQIRFAGADDVKRLAGLNLRLFGLAQRSDPKGPFVNFSRDVKAVAADILEVDKVLPGQGGLRFFSAGTSFCRRQPTEIHRQVQRSRPGDCNRIAGSPRAER